MYLNHIKWMVEKRLIFKIIPVEKVPSSRFPRASSFYFNFFHISKFEYLFYSATGNI